jgi:amino acid adenylation domain-containing protein
MKYILKESGCKVLVTDKKDVSQGLWDVSLSILDINEKARSIAGYSMENLEPVNSPRNLACVLYESDPGGFPKGLMMEHQNLVNLVEGIRRQYPCHSQWLHVLCSPASMDAFIKELFLYQCFILDSYMNLLPIETAGEIYFGGIGVCRGYLNRPGLTAEDFIRNPFEETGLDILYRTGDSGKYLPDGKIVCTGRRDGDEQVKIRGYRVEPGEVRFHLEAFEGVKEAVVRLATGSDGEEVLNAYYVKDDRKPRVSINLTRLKMFLSERLPAYMIPMNFMELEALPLTSGGKIDVSALPRPFVGPRCETEKKISALWSKILGIENINVTADFFQLGGNSIKALLTVSEINELFNVNLLITHLFEYNTIEKFAAFLAGLSGSSSAPPPIEIIEEREYYGVSHAQRRLWVLCQFEESSVAYNIPAAHILKGKLNQCAFRQVFERLVERHESLRTVFITVDGEPKQKIRSKEESGFKFKEIDLRKDAQREERARSLADEETRRVFDLQKGPLVSAALLRLEDEKYLFLLNMHHIISDGWSMGILIEEVCWLYNNGIHHRNSSLSPLKIQYKDFSGWQGKQLKGNLLAKHRQYWLEQFRGEVPVLALPGDYPRPKVKTYNGKRVDFLVSPGLSKEIIELSGRHGTSLFMTLLASVKALLYRYTGQEDIIIGSPISGREHNHLKDQVGFYVNTLALRTVFKGSASFERLLGKVKETSLAAYDHDAYPFDQLVNDLVLERDTSRSPLFDVMVALNPEPGGKPTEGFEGVTRESYPTNSKISKFDWLFVFTRLPGGIYVNIEYNTDLFSRSRIEQMGNHYQALLQAIVNNSQSPLNKLNYLSSEEKHQLLHEFNDTHTEYPKDKVIHQLFEEQAERSPDNIAVIGREQGASVSYKELNERSQQLSYFLQQKGVLADTIAGIMVERSIEMIIGILGILKAGGAYLPIDPAYPGKHINFMLADSGANILVTTRDLSEKIQFEKEVIYLSHLLPFHPSTLPSPHLNPEPVPATCLAYIIYTSGSTGRPKGVMIEHGSAVNILHALDKKYPFSETDTYLLKTTFVFDVSITELFGWFSGGGRLAVLEKNGEKDPQMILDVIARAGVTHINFVPSMFRALLEILDSQNIIKLSRLKYIFLAGEALSPVLVKKFNRFKLDILLENIYGPTESAIYASNFSLSGWEEKDHINIPIGKPLPNIRLYILDKYDHLQPAGVPGELCISGLGLARGYLNRPELTAEKFIRAVNIHSSWVISSSNKSNKLLSNDRLYKTGDLARWLPDGNIEFLGREDQQVKVRGFRIELGEIEFQLLKHEKIKEAIVITRELENESQQETPHGNFHLCAYYTTNEAFTISDLRDYLSQTLPGYMIPTYFKSMDHFPVTSNGKLDRKALPAPSMSRPLPEQTFLAPKTEVEKKMTKIWRDVLKIEKIGINDNFFEIGANSLTLIQINTKLKQGLGIDIPILKLFQYPSIHSLAKYLNQEEMDNTVSDSDIDILMEKMEETSQMLKEIQDE